MNVAEPFRTRSFVAVPPADRPVKHRKAVRVLLRDRAGAYLLFHDTDPGLSGSGWWMTPGGGIDPGETPIQAAIREVLEETGLVVTQLQLVGPLAHRVVIHGYSDQVTVQDELFYRATVDRCEITTAGHTEDEQATITAYAWLTPDELARGDVDIWPADLAILGEADPPECRELGLVEESTVQVSLGCADPAALAAFVSGTQPS